MYQLEEYVNYGELGVCQITSVGKMPELDPKQVYYTIKPLERPENTIFLPVEKADGSAYMRKIITREEALQLMDNFSALEVIDHRDRKEKQHMLERAMKTHLCEEWCRVLKTLHTARAQALATGRKKSSMEETMWKTAENCLTGELAFVLGESREQAKERLQEALLAAHR